MLNFFAIALFQIASFTSGANQEVSASPVQAAAISMAANGSSIAALGGTGGWVGDIAVDGGTGGWVGDIAALGGTGGWVGDVAVDGGTGGWVGDIAA
ncbi:MAG: hypothetical protein JWR44_1457 [Hymenobacter sp.]|nr:hypothetical protein [Hymenobacter sp.]